MAIKKEGWIIATSAFMSKIPKARVVLNFLVDCQEMEGVNL